MFGLPAFLRPKPVHTEPRYYAATRAENKLAHRRAVDRQLELAVAVSALDERQRAAAIASGKDRPLTDKQRLGK